MNINKLKENFEKFLKEFEDIVQIDADVLLDKLENNTEVLGKLEAAGLSLEDFDSIDFIKIAKEADDRNVNYYPAVEVIDIEYLDIYKPDEQKLRKLYKFLEDNLEELGFGIEYLRHTN